MKSWVAICLFMGAGSVWAMSGWSAKERLRGFDLSPNELKQVSIQSGWSSDDPQLMMFEVGNRLSGPIYCVGASFEMKDGKKIQHSFDPKVYVPADQKRNASVRGIEKKNLKSFGFTCRCMRQAPQAVCENPYK
jgi:hypothetical protein